jgi:hypothetical protein
MFKFKDVEIAFNFKELPQYDQEYLRTMSYETAMNKSVKNTGWGFHEVYSEPDNFTMFDDLDALQSYMDEFVHDYDYVASHLLHGKKYYFAWTFSQRNR